MCGAIPDEGCEIKVEYFERCTDKLYAWLHILYKLGIAECQIGFEDEIRGYEFHDLLEPLMIEKFK
jgi:hypothetical protein